MPKKSLSFSLSVEKGTFVAGQDTQHVAQLGPEKVAFADSQGKTQRQMCTDVTTIGVRTTGRTDQRLSITKDQRSKRVWLQRQKACTTYTRPTTVIIRNLIYFFTASKCWHKIWWTLFRTLSRIVSIRVILKRKAIAARSKNGANPFISNIPSKLKV